MIRSDQSLSRVRLFATPWITARQASLSITNSWSSLRLTSIKSVMPSNHLILCRPLLLLPPGRQFTDQAFQSAEIQGGNESNGFIAIKGYGFREKLCSTHGREYGCQICLVSHLFNRLLHSKFWWPGEGWEWNSLLWLCWSMWMYSLKTGGLGISTDCFPPI